MLRFLKQLLLKIFCYIWESFWGNVKFLWCVHSKKYHKIITGPVNGCGILQTGLRCLEYIIRFLIKLLVKLCFENFWILLKFCWLFKIFAPQKPPWNCHRCLKRMQLLPKLLDLLKIYVESFDKIVQLSIFVRLASIFIIIFSFDSVFAHKVHKNCHNFLKWAWHWLNQIVSFRVYIKISDKLVS